MGTCRSKIFLSLFPHPISLLEQTVIAFGTKSQGRTHVLSMGISESLLVLFSSGNKKPEFILRLHPLKGTGKIQISATLALYAPKPLQLIVFSERHLQVSPSN